METSYQNYISWLSWSVFLLAGFGLFYLWFYQMAFKNMFFINLFKTFNDLIIL